MKGATSTAHRVSEFYKWYKGGSLVLNADYQRNPVWTYRNKSYLMDTILHDLPVPEIYMQIKTDSGGNTTYEVIDGQQRMRAILEFIDNEYVIVEEESPDFGGKDFVHLTEGNKRDFWDYQLIVREIKTNSHEDIKSLFTRLNKYVVPLNDQERRHATYFGDFSQLVEGLAEDGYWAENRIVRPSEIRRMKNSEFVSELLLAMMEGVQEGTESLDRAYASYDVNFKDKDTQKKHFEKTLGLIEDIMSDLRGTHWENRSDFYALFVAVSELLKDYTFLLANSDEIKTALVEFRRQVALQKDAAKEPLIHEYYKTIGYGGLARKEIRAKRVEIVRKILIPFIVPKDRQRGFTEEQRQYAWDLSQDKLCKLCDVKVEWVDYHLDHIIPHSKGGLTVISNSQITHKKCNESRGNR